MQKNMGYFVKVKSAGFSGGFGRVGLSLDRFFEYAIHHY